MLSHTNELETNQNLSQSAAQHRVAPDSLAGAILPTRSSLKQVPLNLIHSLQGRR